MLHTLLFDTPFYDNNLASWALALSITAAGTTLLRLTIRSLRARLGHVAPTTDTLLDDLLLDVLQRTHFFFELAVGVLLGHMLLTLPGVWEVGLHRLLVVAVVLQLGLWANGAVHYGVVLLIDRRAGPEDLAQQSGRNLVRALGLGLVWAVALLMGMDNVGIDVSTAVTGLGVTGLAVGLAGQQIGSDLFASAAILLDRSLLVGDFVVVDGIYLGNVERIGILKTHLRSLGGEKIIFANSDLAKSRVRNFRTLEERRVVLPFRLESTTRASAIEALLQGLTAALQNNARVRFDRAHWAGYGEHGFAMEVIYYAQTRAYNEFMDIQQHVNLTLLRLLETHGIKLAVGLAIRPEQVRTHLAP